MSERPDPDELLKRVRDEEARAKRGKLTIFFGAAPGVGKTYAMLEAARSERDLKRDVVVGVVETHGRYDTGALLLGLELLPRRKVEHRNVTLDELDLDAALARNPGVILVDELAHTNAPGSRHAKRWQDVDELIEAGIDVYTTLNVQHLESLNDVVAQITGIIVRETVPDAMVERADDVKLIDLPPGELIERLKEGKVYVHEAAVRAGNNFFREGNLIALRELALRRTAARVDAEMQSYRAAHGIVGTWAAGQRILVCISPSPASAHLVRATRRRATDAHAEWLAVYVETPAAIRLTAADRARVTQHLGLAEQLGAETVTLTATDPTEATLRYARSRNVTRIVLGKPTHARWRDLIRPSFLEQMVRRSGDIDIDVISGEGTLSSAPAPSRVSLPTASIRSGPLMAAAAIVAACSLTGWYMFGQSRTEAVMVYILGIVIVAMRFGYAASIFAAILSVLAFDYFFIPPYFSLSVDDPRHVVTFGVMFVVAVVISHLTKRVREQAAAAHGREMRTATLYAMARDLASTRSTEKLAAVAAKHVHEVFDAKTAILLPNDKGELHAAHDGDCSFVPDEKERGVAEWAWRKLRPAGVSTETLPFAKALYTPLRASRGAMGVLGVLPTDPRRFVDIDQRQLLETFASQIASAIERAELAEDARRAQVQVETEQLRSSLLSSVSHDLRTPLAVVTGAAGALLEDARLLGEPTGRELLQTIADEAERLNRLVSNLLDMTRLESGALTVKKEWQPLEEVIGAALNRMETMLEKRPVSVKLPADLPLVPIDSVSIEQVFINLLENAAKYTPEGTPVDISARRVEGGIEVEVADRGAGIPEGQEVRIFDKFHRAVKAGAAGSTRGVGLGLAICRGIVAAHGGRIRAEGREGGGASFCFTLPIDGVPPQLEMREAPALR